MILAQLHPSFYAPAVTVERRLLGGTLGSWTEGQVAGGVEYRFRGRTDAHYEYPFFVDESTTYEGSVPAESVVDVSGVLTRASGFEGIAKALFTRGGASRKIPLDFQTFESSTQETEVTGAVTGEYLDFSSSAVITALEGETEIYVGGNRNPDSGWPHAALTAVPYVTSRVTSARFCSTAITRRHCLTAKHYHPHVGDTITWKTTSNESIVRSVVSVAEVPWCDLAVIALDSDLPVSITPLPIVGDWFGSVDTTAKTHRPQHAGIFQDQFRDLCFFSRADVSVIDSTLFQPTGTWGEFSAADYAPASMTITSSFSSGRLPALASYFDSRKYYGESGDSGLSGVVPIADGAWAVAGAYHTAGTFAHPHEDLVNALIAAADASAGISTGYTATIASDPTA